MAGEGDQNRGDKSGGGEFPGDGSDLSIRRRRGLVLDGDADGAVGVVAAVGMLMEGGRQCGEDQKMEKKEGETAAHGRHVNDRDGKNQPARCCTSSESG